MLKKLRILKSKLMLGAVGLFTLSLTAVAMMPGTANAATTLDDDFEYAGSFYWRDSCDEAGKAGIPKAWSDYYCDGSGWPWDDYDLYVKYN